MKEKILFGILTVAMLCALPFCLMGHKTESAYAVNSEQEQSVESEKWTKEDTKEVLSYVALGSGSMGVALGTFIPILKNIKRARNTLESASTGIVSEKKNNEVSAEELKLQKQEYHKAMKRTDETLFKMEQKLSEIETICKLGFVNNKELVSKGVATTISKVGQNEEHKE